MNYEILFEGRLIEPVSGNGWLVELSNGHRLIGFLQKKERELKNALRSGLRVRLEATPFDLSKGRIIDLLEIEKTDDES